MKLAQLLHTAEFVVDGEGRKKAVLVDWEVWEELIMLLEDLEDAEEIGLLREQDEEVISWEEAKTELRASGVDV